MSGLTPLEPADLDAARALLERCSLPSEDLRPEHMEHFVGVREGGELIAFGGLEIFADAALLRSVSVERGARGRGLARGIVASLEERAQSLRRLEVYLLTETADSYFARLGYSRIAREDAPASIAGSTQFSQLCPGSAVLMHKTLDP